jgi:hypothetical protein
MDEHILKDIHILKLNILGCDRLHPTLNDKSAAELQELLEMCAGILIGLATEWAGLHHRNETHLDLKIFQLL